MTGPGSGASTRAAELAGLLASGVRRGVAASVEVAEDRPAVRVELTDAIRLGTYGVDYVDEPTFLLLPGSFVDGTVSVDVLGRLRTDAPEYARAFIGLAYRVRDDDRGGLVYESVYLRPLNGRRYDPPAPRDRRAVQYYAYPDWKFDRLRADEPDGRWEAGADIAAGVWATLRLDVAGRRLVVSVDGEQVLDIADCKGEVAAGRIGLWVDIGTEGFFSDVVIEHADRCETPDP
jgi:hypothetical protein